MHRQITLAKKFEAEKEKQADIKRYGVSIQDRCLIKFTSFNRSCTTIRSVEVSVD
ncbi:hypothetical protein HpEKB20_01130 [Helicobacter pylori]|uniref:hypothetical protein n=1 Tax=Helicobacter pylori TaxID=210 RepID=UPI0018832B2D|nr:hypothetical protein [Helicobacter pylori]GHP26078.1 hypothetical protein VN0211_03870 [Helicobacter pylori]